MTSSYAYSKRWHHEAAHGLRRTSNVDRVRAHLQALLDAGWSQRAIADTAHVSPTTVNSVIRGDQAKIRNDTARRLLAVSSRSILTRSNPLGFVRRDGAKLRIQALLALGHRHDDITAAMRRADTGCRVYSHLVLAQRGAWIARATHDAVAAAYDELSMTPGPSLRTRKRALTAGYIPPLGLNDGALDEPGATLTTDPDLDDEDELDEIAVHRIMTGTLRLPAHSRSPERVEAIRRLARNLSDAEIGDRVGLTGDAVLKVRQRNHIPAGRTSGRAAS